MNKIQLLAVFAGLITLVSCEEKGPLIDFGGEKKMDTTYIESTPEGAMPKKVMVEEFTGVSCPPCPAAQRKLQQFNQTHPNKMVVIAYHIKNFPQTNPTDKSKYDFRTDDATDAGGIFGGVGQLPNAGIDRTVTNNGKRLYDASTWSATIEGRMVLPSPVNIHMVSTYDDATREAIIKVKIAYTSAVTVNQVLTLAIVENDIEDAQKDGLTEVENYIHEHILRDIITPVNGNAFLNNVDKPAGRVYERTFKYTVNKDWKADNCKLVAFVTNDDGDNKEVVQAEEIYLNK